MTERPILFSAPMVRALLAGTKKQTRRALRVQPPSDAYAVSTCHHPDPRPHFYAWVPREPEDGGEISDWPPVPCPYGAPGDRLWVREAFIHKPADYCWEASVSIPSLSEQTVYRADQAADARGAGWSPSIHMPRRLSRVDLEVVAVRVERLQAISEADAIAEGIRRVDEGFERFHVDPDAPSGQAFTRNPILAYRGVWESINGAGSWDANPWVWVVEFSRLGQAWQRTN